MNEGSKMAEKETNALAGFVDRMNKFLQKADFVTEESLKADLNRVATETGLTAESVQKVMESTLSIMEERQATAGIDSSRIGEGFAYGAHIVNRPGLRRRIR